MRQTEVVPVADAPEETLGTRDRILAEARRIVDENGVTAATMKGVANAAGVSRQAVYLHFSDRSQLLSALSDYIDDQLGLGDWMARISKLDNGKEMLRMLAVFRCQRSAGLASLVRSVENDRFRDKQAHMAWRRRHQVNVDWMENVLVRQLRLEGNLHETWKTEDAATFLVTLFSLRNWDDLTQAWGWSDEQYIDTMLAASVAAMVGPARLPRSRTKGTALTSGKPNRRNPPNRGA